MSSLAKSIAETRHPLCSTRRKSKVTSLRFRFIPLDAWFAEEDRLTVLRGRHSLLAQADFPQGNTRAAPLKLPVVECVERKTRATETLRLFADMAFTEASSYTRFLFCFRSFSLLLVVYFCRYRTPLASYGREEKWDAFVRSTMIPYLICSRWSWCRLSRRSRSIREGSHTRFRVL